MFGLGSSSQLGIGIAIKLNDEFSGNAQKVNDQLKAIKANSMSAASSAISSYRNSSAMIAGGAALVSGALFEAAKSGAEFQHSINQIYTVGGKDLGKTKDQLADFANQMSKTFAVDPGVIAKSMFDNVTAGVTTNLQEITKYQLAVSQAANENLGGEGGVAQKLLGIMGAYDMSTSKIGFVANALTAAGNASLATISSMGESMEYAAFTAHQFNVPLEQTLAMLAKLSQSKIYGSAAGTGLTNMMQQFGGDLGPFATKQQKAAMRMLRLDPRREKGLADSGNFFQVLKDIQQSTNGMSPSDKTSILKVLFNRRGLRAAEGMFDSKSGNKGLDDFLKDIKEGVKSDIAMSQAKKMQDDLHSDFIFLHNSIVRLKNDFSHSLEPVFRLVIHGAVAVADFIGVIIKNPIGKVLVGLVAVAAPVISVMFAFRAALLATTFALKGFGQAESVGGFSSLLKAGLGMAGMGRFGGNAIRVNSAGSLTVPAGRTFGLGPLAQTGGQIISAENLAGLGIGRIGGKTAKVAEEAEGFFGKGLGFLGESAGMLGDLLPVVGEVAIAVQVLMGIWDLFKKKDDDKPKQDALLTNYYRNLDAAYYGSSNSKDWYNAHPGQSRNSQDKNGLNQNINLYVDGQQTQTKVLNQQLDSALSFGLQNIEMNLKH